MDENTNRLKTPQTRKKRFRRNVFGDTPTRKRSRTQKAYLFDPIVHVAFTHAKDEANTTEVRTKKILPGASLAVSFNNCFNW